MTAAWPGTVNQNAITNTYHEKKDRNVATFQPEVGPAMERRRTSVGSYTMSFDILLTTTEVAALKTFYDTTLADGSLYFTFTHPLTGATVTAKFVESPDYRDVDGQFFRPTISLRTLPA